MSFDGTKQNQHPGKYFVDGIYPSLSKSIRSLFMAL